MKFGEYVGHVKTPKIEKPNIIKINNREFYLGFGVSKKSIKRVYDYIKSWFLRYHIPFKPINPYLTLYILKNIPFDKRELIYKIKDKKDDFMFSAGGAGSILIVEDEKIEVQLEYTPNYFFMEDILEEIFFEMGIKTVKEYCYIKLFEIEQMPDNKLLDSMMYSCPKFPRLKLGHIGLRRK